MYGKTVTGVIRSTFVVDEKGKIESAQYNVKAAHTATKVRRFWSNHPDQPGNPGIADVIAPPVGDTASGLRTISGGVTMPPTTPQQRKPVHGFALRTIQQHR